MDFGVSIVANINGFIRYVHLPPAHPVGGTRDCAKMLQGLVSLSKCLPHRGLASLGAWHDIDEAILGSKASVSHRLRLI